MSHSFRIFSEFRISLFKTFSNMFNEFAMWYDEIYDLLLSTIPCFSGEFMRMNGTEKKK